MSMYIYFTRCRVFNCQARPTPALVWLFLLHLLQFFVAFFVACRLFVTLRHRTVSKRHRPLMGACTGFECERERGACRGPVCHVRLWASTDGNTCTPSFPACSAAAVKCAPPLPTFLLQSLNLFTAPPSLPSLLGAAPSLSTSTFSQSRQQLDLCVRLVFSPRQPLVFPSTTTTHKHTQRKAKSVTHTHTQGKAN